MDAMVLLEGDAMRRVYREFKTVSEEQDRGLTLLEFISAFVRNVDTTSTDTKSIIQMLVDLFEQIDVNGDQSLEWSEFVSYCVEAGLSAGMEHFQRPTFLFSYDAHFADEITKSGGIIQLVYHEATDLIITTEAESRIVHFYDGQLNLLRSLDTSTCIRAEYRDTDTTVPLRCTMLDAFQTVAVLLSNLNIAFWKIGPRAFSYVGMIKRNGLDNIPCMIHYDTSSTHLLVALKDGTIRMYNPGTRALICSVKEHNDLVLAMCSVPHRTSFVSSDVQARVLLWGVEAGSHKVLRELTGQTTAAHKLLEVPSLELIFGLCVNGEVVGWDVITGEVVMRFGHEHTKRVRDIVILPTTPARLLSIDSAWNAKVWEIASASRGTCPCIMTYPMDELIGHPFRFAVATVPRRLRKASVQTWMVEQRVEAMNVSGSFIGDLIIAAPRMYRVTTTPSETVEPPVYAIYDYSLYSFVTVTAKDAFLWDGDTGAQVSTFRASLRGGDVVCACVDDRQRKLFVGDNSGYVTAINLMNGAEMKASDKFSPISKVCYHSHSRCVVAATTTGALIVLDDEPQAHLDELRRVQHAHAGPITALALSEELAFIATGDSSGVVRCWDFQSVLCILDIQPCACTITSILCCFDIPAMAIAYEDGSIRFWSSDRHLQPKELFVYMNEHEVPEAYSTAGAKTLSRPGSAHHLGQRRRSSQNGKPISLPSRSAELEKVVTETLDSNLQLGTLVEQILADYQAKACGSDKPAFNPKQSYKITYAQRSIEQRRNTAELAAFIEIRRVRTQVTVVAMSWLRGGVADDEFLLACGDELGHVRVLNVGRPLQMQVSHVAKHRWPITFASYDPRRVMTRTHPVFDFAWEKAVSIASSKPALTRTPTRTSFALRSTDARSMSAMVPTTVLLYRPHRQAINCLSAFSLPGLPLCLITGSADGRSFLWDVQGTPEILKGQLGLIPQDQDLIALGRLKPTRWQVPPQKPEVAAKKESHAAKLLEHTISTMQTPAATDAKDAVFLTSFDVDEEAAAPQTISKVVPELGRELRLAEVLAPHLKAERISALQSTFTQEAVESALMEREGSELVRKQLEINPDWYKSTMVSEEELQNIDDKAVLQMLQMASDNDDMSSASARTLANNSGKVGSIAQKASIQTLLSTKDPVGNAAAYLGRAAATVIAMCGYEYKGTAAERDIVKTGVHMGWFEAESKAGKLPTVLSTEDAINLATLFHKKPRRDSGGPGTPATVSRATVSGRATPAVTSRPPAAQKLPFPRNTAHKLPAIHLDSPRSPATATIASPSPRRKAEPVHDATRARCEKLDVALEAPLAVRARYSKDLAERIASIPKMDEALRGGYMYGRKQVPSKISHTWKVLRATSIAAVRLRRVVHEKKHPATTGSAAAATHHQTLVRPRPGAALPPTLGPYDTMLVIKVRSLFDECSPDEAGTVDTARLSRHPAWKELEGVAWRADVSSARTTLPELFDAVFTRVPKAQRGILLEWTEPDILSQLDVQAKVDWREVLSDPMIASFSAIFDSLDEDGSGAVSLQEIEDWHNARKASGEGGLSLGDILEIIYEFHTDPGAEISRDDFMTMMATALTTSSRVTVGKKR